MEIVFSVTQETDGGFVAECLTHDIFTQGDTWEELRANVQEAVTAYFSTSRSLPPCGCIWFVTRSWRWHEAAARLERCGSDQAALQALRLQTSETGGLGMTQSVNDFTSMSFTSSRTRKTPSLRPVTEIRSGSLI
ncbi:MAG: type II toxin-antitoxin system HicB family antitoxin [Terrimicrobiaceae bacterium]|nr:type II toxin-antitoxin system HicB family antitoxin [Terrimicrobiaceae bacterium]